jgi:SNF2 family DNA or RNA helicase
MVRGAGRAEGLPTLAQERFIVVIVTVHDEENLAVEFAYDPDLVDAIKSLPNRKWYDGTWVTAEGEVVEVKRWTVPIDDLHLLREKFANNIIVRQEVLDWINERQRRQQSVISTWSQIDSSPQYWQHIENPFMPLFPHQKSAVCFLYNCFLRGKGGALWDEAGLGKTGSTLTALLYAQRYLGLERALIVCPNYLKSVWAEEIEKFTDLPYVVIEGGPIYRQIKKKRHIVGHERLDLLQLTRSHRIVEENGITGLATTSCEPFFVIANYDTFSMETGDETPIFDRIVEIPWGAIVLDEAQAIKSPRTKVTERLLELSEKQRSSSIRIELTGTPMMNNPEEIWSQVAFIDCDLLGDWWRFQRRYVRRVKIDLSVGDDQTAIEDTAQPRKKKFFWKTIGYKRQQELQRKLDTISLRRLKSKVLDLPEKTHQVIKVDLAPAQAKAYDELVAEAMTYVGEELVEAESRLTLSLRLKQVCDTLEIFDANQRTSAKMKVLDDLVQSIVRDGGHKLCVYCQFRPVLHAIVRDYADLNPVWVSGEIEDESERLNRRRQFQNDPDVKLWVAMPRSAAEGITLTASQYLVHFGHDWNPATNLQAEDRVHRIGQEGAVTIISLITRGTIEERVMAVLDQKTQQTGRVIRQEPRELFSGMSAKDFIKMIERKK